MTYILLSFFDGAYKLIIIMIAMKYERDSDTNCNWCTSNDPQRLGKGTERLGNKRTSRDDLNYSIIKISQNIQESPGDLRRLDVTQTPVKDYQLMLVVKI